MATGRGLTVARPAWTELFPWPFVGVVALLVALIFLTPNLITTNEPAAGSLITQAELVVDRGPGANATDFYLEGLGNVRYAEIRWAIAAPGAWPVTTPVGNLTWNVSGNVTARLVAVFSSPANPVAVNVSMVCVDAAGVRVTYVGAFAFDVAGGMLNTLPLLGGLGGVPPTSVADLPIVLVLETAPPGAG